MNWERSALVKDRLPPAATGRFRRVGRHSEDYQSRELIFISGPFDFAPESLGIFLYFFAEKVRDAISQVLCQLLLRYFEGNAQAGCISENISLEHMNCLFTHYILDASGRKESAHLGEFLQNRLLCANP